MKKVFLTILIVISTVCIALDCWFGYLHFFGKEKINNNSFTLSGSTIEKSDALTGEVVKEEQLFCNVSIYKNAIELNFTSLMDESKSAFLSQGIQLICKNERTMNDSDILSYYLGNGDKDTLYNNEDETPEIITNDKFAWTSFNETRHKIYMVKRTYFNNFDIYEYQSIYKDRESAFENPQTSKDLMNHNELFKILIDGKIYGIKFKDFDKKFKTGTTQEVLKTDNLTSLGTQYKYEDRSIRGHKDYHYIYTTTYRALDLTYFIEWLVNSTTGLKTGLETENYFKVPDMFDYYSYDEQNNSYSNLISDESEQVKLYNYVSNYFRIGVKNNRETELSSTKQSLFKIIANNSNFGNDDSTNYTIGRFVLKLTNKDLDYSLNEENKAVFTIKDEVVDKYKNKSIYLFVTINLDDQNLTYGGFNLKDNSKFTIYKIVDTVGNNLLEVA